MDDWEWKCRLCSALRFREIDVLENNSSRGPNVSDALREKIFQCVGIEVSNSKSTYEENTKLTHDDIQVKSDNNLAETICGTCYRKIDKFLNFRKMCTAANVQLRKPSLIGVGNTSIVDAVGGATTTSEIADAFIGEGATDVETNAMSDMGSADAEM